MASSKENRPIGIFDSGLGGLTVFAEVKKRLPHESIIYLGDTARVPYGTKSAETVIRYSLENSAFLVERGVKAIVVACNTASALALPALKARFEVPILGVVLPGAEEAVRATKKSVVGVIGTSATIASDAYARTLKGLKRDIRVVSQACPLFVPLVEEGWLENEVAEAAARRYLSGIDGEGIDVLILGCTHYPLLKPLMKKIIGSEIKLIDSAEATAKVLEALLNDSSLACSSDRGETGFDPSFEIYVTDLPARFESIARRFLGDDIPRVRHVAI